MALAAVRSKAVILLLLIGTPIVGFCNCSIFYCALLFVHSSFAIISKGKRELVDLLCLYRDCFLAHPHDATGLSAVCYCGISRSYSLTILY